MAFYSSSLFQDSSDDSLEDHTSQQLEPLFDETGWYSDEDFSSSFSVFC